MSMWPRQVGFDLPYVNTMQCRHLPIRHATCPLTIHRQSRYTQTGSGAVLVSAAAANVVNTCTVYITDRQPTSFWQSDPSRQYNRLR